MPQCQFPIFCCFVFQKSYIGNILGMGWNEDRNSYFSWTKDKHRTRDGGGPEGSHTLGKKWPIPSPDESHGFHYLPMKFHWFSLLQLPASSTSTYSSCASLHNVEVVHLQKVAISESLLQLDQIEDERNLAQSPSTWQAWPTQKKYDCRFRLFLSRSSTNFPHKKIMFLLLQKFLVNLDEIFCSSCYQLLI
jgi:hypothetical protein